MKTTMPYSLLFLTLLGVSIGCKKELEPVEDLQYSVYPPDCQIERTIYKNSSYSRKPDDTFNPEIITLAGGSKIKVSLVLTTKFVYDLQGRTLEQKMESSIGGYYFFRCAHAGNRLMVRGDYFPQPGGQNSTLIQNDTLILNDQGFVLYQGTSKTNDHWPTIRPVN